MNYLLSEITKYKSNIIIPEISLLNNDIFRFADNKKLTYLSFQYNPFLRLHLHENDLDNMIYNNIFDMIQNLSNDAVCRSFNIENIYMDENITWIKHNTIHFGFLNSVCKYKIYYSDFGYIKVIEVYQGSLLEKKFLIDDRGIISSCIFYENNIPIMQNFFDSNFNVVIKASSNEVLWFKNKKTYKYSNINNLIETFLYKHFNINTNKIYVVPTYDTISFLHTLKVKNELNLIDYSSNVLINEDTTLLLKNMNVKDVVVDNTKKKIIYERVFKDHSNCNIMEILPLHKHLKKNCSDKIKDEIISIYISDSVEIDNYYELYKKLGLYLSIKKNTKVCFFGDHRNLKQLSLLVSKNLITYNWNKKYMSENEEINNFDINGKYKFLDNESINEKFKFIETNNQNTEQSILYKSRILIDLTSFIKCSLLSCAISIGLPIITNTVSKYLDNVCEVYKFNSCDDILKIVRFYLDNISNWNKFSANCEYLNKKEANVRF